MKTLAVKQVYEGENYEADCEQHTPRYSYKVLKITNAVKPPIGTRLLADELAAYCESDTWSVTIT